MQFLSNKSRTRSRRAAYVHAVLNIILPIGVLLLIRAKLPYLAVALVLLAKWRVIAVQPRYWLANVRSNSVDTIVGISFVILIHSTTKLSVQLLMTAAFASWLLLLKPRSESIWVSTQALVAQTLGIVALQDYVANRGGQVWPEFAVVLLAFGIALACSRHFLSNYEDRYLSAVSFTWALFIAELAWLLNHWILFYVRYVSSLALLSAIFGYICMRLYAKTHTDSLSRKDIRSMIIFTCAILLVVVLLSNWRRSLY